MFRFRKASIEDAPQIALTHVTAWSETYQGLMPDVYIQTYTLKRREALWCKVISENLAEVLVAEVIFNESNIEEESRLAGFLSYEKAKGRESDFQDNFSLSSLYVLSEYQGLGVGRGLYRTFEDALLVEVGSASTCIHLWVLDSNLRALSFYRYLGFNETGKQLKEEVQGTCLIDLEMVKTLLPQKEVCGNYEP